MNSLRMFFGFGNQYMPHGMCYLWTPGLVWLHVISDSLIALAYTSIPITLLYVVRKRTDLPFNWMFTLFGVFIVACGATHFMAAWNVWHADYWLSGGVKLVTALASVPTAVILIALVPRILKIPTRKELEDAHHRLEDAFKELEQFTYAVSHDLRAPLRAIDGHGRILENRIADKLDEGDAHNLRRMREASKRMGELIDALLELSRLSRGQLHKAVIDLSKLAEDVTAELRAADPGRDVEVRIAPSMCAIGDHALMRVVLENLLGNAWKFTAKRAGAIIECGIQNSDDRSVFYIKDNGAGFDMQYAGKLFNVFQRLHSPDEYEGHGVGLASVQRIIHRHGGSIWGEGELERGSTFYFTLAEEG